MAKKEMINEVKGYSLFREYKNKETGDTCRAWHVTDELYDDGVPLSLVPEDVLDSLPGHIFLNWSNYQMETYDRQTKTHIAHMIWDYIVLDPSSDDGFVIIPEEGFDDRYEEVA